MNKFLFNTLVLTVAAYASSAHAQSNVKVYGIVDTGLEHLTNADAAGNSVTKLTGLGGSLPSRIGFRDTEDLGGGLSVIFQVENGFAPDTGGLNQGGRLFGRQAFVGLTSPYGTFKLGRQYNMTYIVQAKSDTFGGNLYSIGSLDPYLPNARTDNALGYLGTFSEFTVGATYSFGRDASPAGATGPRGVASATNCPGESSANPHACRQTTAMLDYDHNIFGLAASYDVLNGGPGELNGLADSNFRDKRVALMGFVMAGSVRIGAGGIDRKITTTVDGGSRIYFLGASYPITPSIVLDAQASRNKIKNSPNSANMMLVRATYNLSKTASVYAFAGYIRNSGTSALSVDAGSAAGPGLNQTGVMTGIRKIF
jgi:predicted porin